MGNSTEIGWRQLRQKILWEQRSRAGEESEELGHLGEKAGELSKGLVVRKEVVVGSLSFLLRALGSHCRF